MKKLFIIGLTVDGDNVTRQIIKVIETSHTYSGHYSHDLINLLQEEGFSHPFQCEGIRTDDCHDIFKTSYENKNWNYAIAVTESELLAPFDTTIENDYVKSASDKNRYICSKLRND